MQIRRAIHSDWPDLLRIYRDARQRHFTWVDAQTRAADDLQAQTVGEHLYVAVDAGEILGFVSIWPDESFVHHLYVAEPHRRRGVGTLLLKHLQARYPHPFRLKCAQQNASALEFYRSRRWRLLETGFDHEGPYLHLEWRPPESDTPH